MTNLTEYSWYYCKMNDGDIRMLERGADYFLDGDVPLLNNEVKSVLAEVPSYEEWQAKLEENAQLKELLKEVRGKLKYINTPRNNHNIFENDLMKKINQVLGEE